MPQSTIFCASSLEKKRWLLECCPLYHRLPLDDRFTHTGPSHVFAMGEGAPRLFLFTRDRRIEAHDPHNEIRRAYQRAESGAVRPRHRTKDFGSLSSRPPPHHFVESRGPSLTSQSLESMYALSKWSLSNDQGANAKRDDAFRCLAKTLLALPPGNDRDDDVTPEVASLKAGRSIAPSRKTSRCGKRKAGSATKGPKKARKSQKRAKDAVPASPATKQSDPLATNDVSNSLEATTSEQLFYFGRDDKGSFEG
jgi:hypothetical protein